MARLAEFLTVDATAGDVRHALACAMSRTQACRTRHDAGSNAQVAASILADSDDDGESEAALLSMHFFQAHRYDEAWHYALIAADAAREVYADAGSGEAVPARRARCSSRRRPPRQRRGTMRPRSSHWETCRTRSSLSEQSPATRTRQPAGLFGDTPVAISGVLLKEAFVAESGRFVDAVRPDPSPRSAPSTRSSPPTRYISTQLMVSHPAIRAGQGRVGPAAEAARPASRSPSRR